MAESATETALKPSSGQWIWNDETQSLEFISSEAKVEVKEKKKSKTSTYQEHFRKHLEKWQRNTATADQLEAFKTLIKHSQKACVTIQDVKLAAVCLLQENDGLPIPLPFLTLLKSKELDELLANLLLYFSCFFEKKALEERVKTLMVVESDSEWRTSLSVQVKLDQAQQRLAQSYSILLLDEDRLLQRHTAHHRIKVSSTHCDTQLYECLFSFCGYAVWVTFERRDLKAIQLEIGRLFRSNTFNPILRTLHESEDNSQKGQSELEEPLQTQLNNRRSKRHPALRCVLHQCSPLMASLLPTPRESAQHLFKDFRALKKPSTEHCNVETLVDELTQQINNLRFGILGKPLNKFSSRTLKPLSEEETENEEDDDVIKTESHIHIRSSVTGRRSLITSKAKRSGRGEIFSRATTEAPSSDTE